MEKANANGHEGNPALCAHYFTQNPSHAVPDGEGVDFDERREAYEMSAAIRPNGVRGQAYEMSPAIRQHLGYVVPGQHHKTIAG